METYIYHTDNILVPESQVNPNPERPGQCPDTGHLNACSMYTSCIFDNQCPTNQKCCRVSSGSCSVDTCIDTGINKFCINNYFFC